MSCRSCWPRPAPSSAARCRSRAIDPAAEAGLVDVDAAGHVHFRHPLMASAIHRAASFADRVRVHDALADALDHLPDRQVWHRASAAVGVDEPLSCEVERSAERALQRGAPAMGVSALRRAAELTADPARRSSLLLRAAELAGELGQRGVVAELVSLADPAEMGPIERARLVAVGEIVALGDLSDAGRLRSMIEAAAQALDAGGRDVAVDLLGGRRPGASGVARRTRPERRSSPRSIGPGSLRTIRVGLRSWRTRSPSRTAPRCCDDSRTGRRIASTRRRCASWAARHWCSATFRRRARASRTAAAAYRAEGRLGLLARTLATRSWGQMWVGGWDQVLADLEESSRLAAETGEQLWAITATIGKAMLSALRGDSEAAERIAAEAQAIPLLAGVRFILVATQQTRGVAALLAGRADEAFDHLIRIFDPTDPMYHPSMSTWALSDLVDAAVVAGRVDAVRSVLDGVERRATQLPSPMLQINVRYARAVLADGDSAGPLFDAALAADLSAWPLARSRLLLAHGMWLEAAAAQRRRPRSPQSGARWLRRPRREPTGRSGRARSSARAASRAAGAPRSRATA